MRKIPHLTEEERKSIGVSNKAKDSVQDQKKETANDLLSKTFKIF